MNAWLIFFGGMFIGSSIGIIIMELLQVNTTQRDYQPESRYDDTRLFLLEVHEEIERARVKFPSNEHLLAALMEEVGELAKAHLEDESYERKRAEAIQVACVAARIAVERDGDY